MNIFFSFSIHSQLLTQDDDAASIPPCSISTASHINIVSTISFNCLTRLSHLSIFKSGTLRRKDQISNDWHLKGKRFFLKNVISKKT